MDKPIRRYSKIRENYNYLKEDFPNLTDFELMSLSIQEQRNEIIREGLGVSSFYKNPTYLEEILSVLHYIAKDISIK